MTQDQIIQIQREMGLPSAWEVTATGGDATNGGAYQDVTFTKRERHFISGPSVNAELKGCITINADASGWIRIHTEAGPILIPHQVLSVDGSTL